MLIESCRRLPVLAGLAFLVLFSASSLAHGAAIPQRAVAAASFSSSVILVESHPPYVSFEPLWNGNGWNDSNNNQRKKDPVGVPEGGSVAAYLSLAGLACLLAIGFERRQKSQVQP
jgi:hypothetical protein